MKLTKSQYDKAYETINKLNLKEVYVNESGEFFTQENLASLSVKGDKKKFEKIIKTSSIEPIFTKESANDKLLATKKIESLNFDLEMIPICLALELKLKDQKKQTVINALVSAQDSLQKIALELTKKEFEETLASLEEKKDLKIILETSLAHAEAEKKEVIKTNIKKLDFEIKDLETKLETLKVI